MPNGAQVSLGGGWTRGEAGPTPAGRVLLMAAASAGVCTFVTSAVALRLQNIASQGLADAMTPATSGLRRSAVLLPRHRAERTCRSAPRASSTQ